MEIHSSSLAFNPSGFNAKNRNDQSLDSTTDSETADVNNQANSSASLSIAPADTSKLPQLQKITDDIQQLQQTPTNTRTARAVNAYTQENAESLKTQRAELISGLDIFV